MPSAADVVGRRDRHFACGGGRAALLLGHLPVEPDAAQPFFQLVSRRYEMGAVLDVPGRSVDRTGGHGAPYLNLAIAEQLLRQAQRCNDCSSAHLIAALLASEAYELLLGMSKTTALEALLEMHKAEVKAEVLFTGVDLELMIDPRKKDVEAPLRSLGTDNRVSSIFLSQFWAELRTAYSDGESFAAAEAANRESLINGRWWKVAPKCIKTGLVAVATSFRAWAAASLVAMLLATLLYKLEECTSRCNFLCANGLGASGTWAASAWLVLGLALVSSCAVLATFLAACSSWRMVALSIILVAALSVACVAMEAGCHFPDPTALVSWEGWKSIWDLFQSVVLSSITLQPMTIVKDLVGESAPYHHWVAIIHLGLAYLLFGVLISMLYRKVTRG